MKSTYIFRTRENGNSYRGLPKYSIRFLESGDVRTYDDIGVVHYWCSILKEGTWYYGHIMTRGRASKKKGIRTYR